MLKQKNKKKIRVTRTLITTIGIVKKVINKGRKIEMGRMVAI